MNSQSTILEPPPTAPAETPSVAPPPRVDYPALLDRVSRTVAPLWPLHSFVAVNPYLGHTGRPFAEAGQALQRTAGSRLTMPRRFYAEAIRSGRIRDRDLAEALAEAWERVDGAHHGLPADVDACKQIAEAGEPPAVAPLPTVVDVVGRVTGHDWTRFVVDRISTWASAYFDQGQALWCSPWRDRSPYRAWHAEASLDRTPEVMGVKGFRAAVREMSPDPAVAAGQAIERLGVPPDRLEPYLQRLVMTIGGWAAYARFLVWQSELYDIRNQTLQEVLTIRLAWDALMMEAFPQVHEAWRDARKTLPTAAELTTGAEAQAVDLVLQDAYEKGWREPSLARLSAHAPPSGPAAAGIQAVFCIDVRSEILRRALESVSTGIETIGFAGFFGFPVEVTPLGRAHGGARCPVLLTPAAVVREVIQGADGEATKQAAVTRTMRQRTNAVWKSFKLGAVSCFGFVETMGLAFAPKMITDSLGWTRPAPHPDMDGIDREARARLGPSLAVEEVGGRVAGLDAASRLAMAEGMLAGMSMKDGFGRLVLLVGHGSTTTNNPHAAGLECGACGGHSGAANARIAAAALNDPAVRAGLAEKGIHVPEDTVFIGGVHDTATDEVTMFDTEAAAATHAAELDALRYALHAAGGIARRERAPNLNLASERAVDAAVIGRSRDWSQVRPEWGLAGCAAFIVAPRRRTQGVDLGGRAFLHSYDWRQDDGFAVLELIMTAPMMVASWINLQYFGSTVDTRVFGSGNKVLHNVVGALGVLEGNSGDLRPGLPWQSVHDGQRFVHEPMRLTVIIDAPREAINGILDTHDGVRELFDNQWLHLYAYDEEGRISYRYAGDRQWKRIPAGIEQGASTSDQESAGATEQGAT